MLAGQKGTADGVWLDLFVLSALCFVKGVRQVGISHMPASMLHGLVLGDRHMGGFGGKCGHREHREHTGGENKLFHGPNVARPVREG
jgi:hypothetical protein